MAKREGIMLAYKFDEARLKKLKGPYILQPKFNGDRCRAIVSQRGKVFLVSSGMKVRVSVPHINNALEHWARTNLTGDIELDGELYRHGMRHQDIRSIVSRTKELHENFDEMCYHIFDIVDERPQIERLKELSKLFEHQTRAVNVLWSAPLWFADDLQGVEGAYTKALEMGFEGLIVRDYSAPYKRKKSTLMLKIKPSVSEIFEIFDSVEEVSIKGEKKGSLGALWLRDLDGSTFKVGTGFTKEERSNLWRARDSLPGQFAKVRFQELSKDKIPLMIRFEELRLRQEGG